MAEWEVVATTARDATAGKTFAREWYRDYERARCSVTEGREVARETEARLAD